MATKGRQRLQLERLEARETPDVSFRPGAVLPAPPPVAEVRAAFLDDEAPPAASFGAAPFQVDALFADPVGLEGYLARFAPAAPEEAADPELDLQGWSFLCNYTRKAIRGDESRRGPLPDHEDVVQQVYLEWRLEVGPGTGVLANLLSPESPQRQALRSGVARVIARARYQHDRQREMVELADRPAPDRPGSQEWVDWHIDGADGADGLSGRERRIVELRVEGATFEEIGREVGLPKQRACEAFNAALTRLRQVYAQSA